jgi:hypothetical protein
MGRSAGKTLGILLGAGALTVAGFTSSAEALNWKGYTWLEDKGNLADTFVVNGSDHAVLTTGGAGGQRALRVLGSDFTSQGPNWQFSFSFIDNQLADGSWPIIEAFWNGTGGGGARNFRGSLGANAPLDQNNSWRLMAGAEDANQIGSGLWGRSGAPVPDGDSYLGHFAETKFTAQPADAADGISGGTKRNPMFAVSTGSPTPTVSADTLAGSGVGTLVPRADGNAVTVNVEKLDNGVLEYTWIINGTPYTYQNDYYNNSSATVAAVWDTVTLDQMELRVVGALPVSDTFVFTNFTAGPIPEPASFALLGAGAGMMLLRRRKA